jgi:hypothetical protein
MGAPIAGNGRAPRAAAASMAAALAGLSSTERRAVEVSWGGGRGAGRAGCAGRRRWATAGVGAAPSPKAAGAADSGGRRRGCAADSPNGGAGLLVT